VTSPRLADYIAHILTAIERIAVYTEGMHCTAYRNCGIPKV
jgi:hypothetical protein